MFLMAGNVIQQDTVSMTYYMTNYFRHCLMPWGFPNSVSETRPSSYSTALLIEHTSKVPKMMILYMVASGFYNTHVHERERERERGGGGIHDDVTVSKIRVLSTLHLFPSVTM